MKTPLATTVTKELIIVCCINAVFGSVSNWFLLPHLDSLPTLGGPESATFGFYGASVFFPMIFTFLLSLGIAKRVKAGELVALPQDRGVFFKLPLPSNLTLRAFAFVAVTACIIAPICIALVGVAFGPSIQFEYAFFLNVAYLILISILLTPAVVHTAVRFS